MASMLIVCLARLCVCSLLCQSWSQNSEHQTWLCGHTCKRLWFLYSGSQKNSSSPAHFVELLHHQLPRTTPSNSVDSRTAKFIMGLLCLRFHALGLPQCIISVCCPTECVATKLVRGPSSAVDLIVLDRLRDMHVFLQHIGVRCTGSICAVTNNTRTRFTCLNSSGGLGR